MVKELKKEIEQKRCILNELIVSSSDQEEVLEHSIELDILIGKYYQCEIDY